MSDDPTITRIRTTRHQISERYHHNVAELIAHYRELEQRYHRRVLTQVAHEARESRVSEEHHNLSDVLHTSPKSFAGNF